MQLLVSGGFWGQGVLGTRNLITVVIKYHVPDVVWRPRDDSSVRPAAEEAIAASKILIRTDRYKGRKYLVFF